MQVSIKLTIKDAVITLNAATPRAFIGRDANACALVVNDNSLSRRHAEVFLRGNHFYIRDLGSSNGTWVNNAGVDQNPVALSPGQQVFLGQIPLRVEWLGAQSGSTASGEMPSALKEKVEAKRLQTQAMLAAVPSSSERSGAPTPSPTPEGSAEFPYRKLANSDNGELSISLRGNTFNPDTIIEGVVDFASHQSATVASMGIELLEFQHASDARGQVRDRALLKQGPWRVRKNDAISISFQLRIPPAISMTSSKAHWELRAYADINWDFDVSVRCAILIR